MNDRYTWMGIAGLALVVGFFMPWIDIGGISSVSGWDMVTEGHLGWGTRLILVLCPLLGAGLAISAFGKSAEAPKVALAAGAGVLGYTFYKVAWGFVKISGVGLWMVLGGATLALIFALATRTSR